LGRFLRHSADVCAAMYSTNVAITNRQEAKLSLG